MRTETDSVYYYFNASDIQMIGVSFFVRGVSIDFLTSKIAHYEIAHSLKDYDNAIKWLEQCLSVKESDFFYGETYWLIGNVYLAKSTTDTKYRTYAIENLEMAGKLGNEQAKQWLKVNKLK